MTQWRIQVVDMVGRGGGYPDPEIKKIFSPFGLQFRLKIREGMVSFKEPLLWIRHCNPFRGVI